MDVTCSSSTGCPVILSAECVFYEGAALPDTGIATNDDLQTVIQKLNTAIANGGGGGGSVISVNDGNAITIDNTDPNNPIVNLGGLQTGNITIDADGNTFEHNNLSSYSIIGDGISGAAEIEFNSIVFTALQGGLFTADELTLAGTTLVGMQSSGSIFIDAPFVGLDQLPTVSSDLSDVILLRHASDGQIRHLTIGSGLNISAGALIVTGGGSSVGANNEVQTSNGAGGFVASNLFFDETTGFMELGDSGLAGATRSISAIGSAANIGLIIQSKGTSSAILQDGAGGSFVSVSSTSTNLVLGSNTISATSSGLELSVNAPQSIVLIKHDTSTSTVLEALTLRRTTSGTPANGIGVSLEFEVETSVGNNIVGSLIESVVIDVTSSAESFNTVFHTMEAGVLYERMRMTVVDGVSNLAFPSSGASFTTDAHFVFNSGLGFLLQGDYLDLSTTADVQYGVLQPDGTELVVRGAGGLKLDTLNASGPSIHVSYASEIITIYGNLHILSIDEPSNSNVFGSSNATSHPSSISAAHDVSDVNNGANDTIYHVEATLVVMEVGGNTGGSIKIAGTFAKDGSGNITQIGTTQTLYTAQENISGSLGLTFNIGPSTVLIATSSTPSTTCKTMVYFTVVGTDN